MRQAIGFALILVVLSNLVAWLIYGMRLSREWVYVPFGLLLLSLSLMWARRYAGLSWPELGLAGDSWKRSLAVGALVGLGLSIGLAIFFRNPILLTGPIRYSSVQELDTLGLVWRLAVDLTIAVALTEEILFRGILQALFTRASRLKSAIVFTNVLFALWHLVVNALSLQQNGIALPAIPAPVATALAYAGSLVAVGVGGGILSWLRVRTNHLAGSILVHWAADAAMTLLIY